MQPSQELRQRFRTAISDRRVEVNYYPYLKDEMIVDTLTGEPIDESLAYGPAVLLPALANMQPSKAARGKFGLEQEISAIVRVHVDEVLDRGIMWYVGDKFMLPDGMTYFLLLAKRTKQVRGEYLEYSLALERKAGRSEDA